MIARDRRQTARPAANQTLASQKGNTHRTNYGITQRMDGHALESTLTKGTAFSLVVPTNIIAEKSAASVVYGVLAVLNKVTLQISPQNTTVFARG